MVSLQSRNNSSESPQPSSAGSQGDRVSPFRNLSFSSGLIPSPQTPVAGYERADGRDFEEASVFETIMDRGNCDDFVPREDHPEFRPTQALAGSEEKLAVLAERARRGLPLWHKDDRQCISEDED